MKSKFCVFLSVLMLSTTVYAVDLPEFSFTGEEIASFAISPAFKDIDLSISVPSEYTNYVQKQNIAVAEDTTGEYSAEEPSFIYGARPVVSIASLFVGDRAYRNYLVKKFVQRDYATVVEMYPRYDADIRNDEYREEVRLVYAAALSETGDTQGETLLRGLCLEGEYFRETACDRYMDTMWKKGDYEAVIATGDQIRRPIPLYTFSVYTMAYIRKGDYQKVAAIVNANPDIIFRYADFNDIRASVEYYRGHYDAVVRLMPYTTANIAFITADSLINLDRFREADQVMMKVTSPGDRTYLEAKSHIGQRRHSQASSAIGRVASQQERLDLLKYYVAQEYPRLNIEFMQGFGITDPDKADYLYYYIGLQQLEQRDYEGAAVSLARVRYPDELVAQAKFYRGIALVYIDPDTAEEDIIATMNYSRDPVQVAAARFMLAQVYYMKGRNDDAMQMLDGCEEIYCNQFRSEIELQREDFGAAMAGVEGLDTPQARLIRATAYYNMMEYDLARAELSAMDSNSKEAAHLNMMLLFKEGDVKGATSILTAHKDYTPVLYDGVKELMLVGDYRLALQLMEEEQSLSPEMYVVKAKLLAWGGKNREAKAIYEELLRRNQMVYDSLSGLVALEDTERGEINAVADIVSGLPARGDFPQKDLLLSQLAAKASRAGENVLLVQIVNMFFPEYEESPYAGDMYAERAMLFYNTGRAQECVNDIDGAIAKNPMLGPELRYIKAQCAEEIDPLSAMDDYRAMFEEDVQYRLLAAVKIMDYSNNSYEVLRVAQEVCQENPQLYIEGMRRYVEIAAPYELQNNTVLLGQLETSGDTALKCAALYAKARMLNEDGQAREAARVYREIYETDPKDHFAPIAVDAAIVIYKELGMTAEEAEMVKLRK